MIRPRFEWAGVGRVLHETGWAAAPEFLDLPLVPGSGREIPPWVLAGPVIGRLAELLRAAKRGYRHKIEDLKRPRGRILWAEYTSRQMPAAKWDTLPCRYSDLTTDPQRRRWIRRGPERVRTDLVSVGGHDPLAVHLAHEAARLRNLSRPRCLALSLPLPCETLAGKIGPMAVTETWVLKGKRPRLVATRMERRYRRQLTRLAGAVERSAKGDPEAAREYVSLWSELAADVLERLHEGYPDAVMKLPSGELLVIEAKRGPMEITPQRLLLAAPLAPVSAWVAMEGLRRGLGISLIAEIRQLIPHAVQLTAAPGLCTHWGDPEHMRMALALIGRAAVERVMASPREAAQTHALARVMELFSLDRTEMARLFSVSRQALDHWWRNGVPAERRAKLATILAIGELLEKNLRPGVVPGVARKPTPAYQDRTILELIEADEHDALLKSVRASFDWALPA